MNFTIKQLQYVVAAGDTNSVTRAAQLVNVSQPSISTAIAHVEAVIGTALFIRHHAHGLSPTPSGRRFLVEARHLLTQFQSLHQYAASLSESVSGQLDIGCFVTIAPIVMPHLIAGFRQALPELVIHCHEGTQESLCEDLLRGRAELAILYDLNLPANLHFTSIRSFRPKALVPADHRLADAGRVSLRQLIGEPLILLDRPDATSYLLHVFHLLGLEPNVAYRTASSSMMRGLVAHGLGYALTYVLPKVPISLDGIGYAVLEVTDDLPPLDIGIAYNRGVSLTRAAQLFIEHSCSSAFPD